MRVGDVAAPGALLRAPSPGAAGEASAETLSPVQAAFRARRAVPSHPVPEHTDRRRDPELPSPGRRARGARELQTRHELEDDALAGSTVASSSAYRALRSFANFENLDMGDAFGLPGNDERVRDVLRTLGELASGLTAPEEETALEAARAAPGESGTGASPAGDAGLGGFLASFAAEQDRLEARATLLGDVVSSLSRDPEPGAGA